MRFKHTQKNVTSACPALNEAPTVCLGSIVSGCLARKNGHGFFSSAVGLSPYAPDFFYANGFCSYANRAFPYVNRAFPYAPPPPRPFTSKTWLSLAFPYAPQLAFPCALPSALLPPQELGSPVAPCTNCTPPASQNRLFLINISKEN